MIAIIVNLLILVSQTVNVLYRKGEPDEMLCARAWRLRQDPHWNRIRIFFDEYLWPLSSWKGEYSTHCEACYWEEKNRLQERLRYYTNKQES